MSRRHPVRILLVCVVAVFAVTVSQQTGQPIVGAILFPVGFCTLYLLGYDLLTGVFVLSPLALIDRRPGVTLRGVLRNWGLVFTGNFLGALTVAVMMGIVFTYAFTTEPSPVGKVTARCPPSMSAIISSKAARNGMLRMP